jgi:hypothetical protein
MRAIRVSELSAFLVSTGLRLADTASKADLTIAHEEAPASDADPEEKGAYAYARYAVQNDFYLGHYEDWSKSILFLLRKHWWNFDRRKRRFAPDAAVPPWRQQPVNPLVYAVYRALIAKMTKQRPTLDVIAPSGDTEAVESAELGQSLQEDWHTRLKSAIKDKQTIGWVLATGGGWRRIYWDPQGGRVVPRTTFVELPDPASPQGYTEREIAADENGDPLRLPNGAYDFDSEAEMMNEGEIGDSVENRFSVRLNPEAESVDDATEMFVAHLVPKSKAAAVFGIEVEEIDGSIDDQLELYTDLHSAASASPDDGQLGTVMGSSLKEARGDQCLVLEYYSKQDEHAGFPDGRFWIQLGRKLVSEEKPLPEGFWPPLVPCMDTPVPGQPEPIGVLPQVVPLNEKFNYVDSKIMEHEVTMAMGGKWVVHPSDKNLKITSDPAQVIASKGYAEGKPPVQAKMEGLPADVYEERVRILDLIKFIAGTNDIGLGEKPEGVTSGRGFLVLQEAADSLIMPTLLAFETMKEEIGRRMLVLAQKYYTEERTIKVKGERGRWTVKSFKGSDLVEGLDVRVVTGSSFPWSKSARTDVVLSILQAMPELANNEQGMPDASKVQQMLEKGGIGVFESESDPDVQEVEREQGLFEAYNPDEGVLALPQLAYWQNHPKHLQLHYQFVKTSYMRIAKWHPAAQAAYNQHMLETAAQVQKVVEAMTPPPAPGGPGGGAPPAAGGSGGKVGIQTAAGAQGPKSTLADQRVTTGDRQAAGQTAGKP